MYSIAVFIETPDTEQKTDETRLKKEASTAHFSFEKKVPLTNFKVQLKPWNIA
jgi:hypothetical protein